MATIREGDNAALLVVDAQIGVMAEAWEATRVIGNLATAVARARAAGAPVLWVQHADEELPMGSPGHAIVPQLAPAPGETVIHKRYGSCFEDTELESRLRQLGTTHVVLCGAATNWCIRATAYAALERGYDLTLLQDAHTAPPMPIGEHERIEAEAMVAELNLVLRWIRYPGRACGIVTADAAAFRRAED
jgi:nicotinamidase-related amidase